MSLRIQEFHKRNLATESETPQWNGFYDSPLIPEEGIDFFDSEYPSFNFWFKNTIPESYQNLKDYLEKTYANKKGQLILVEAGGPATKLVSDFSPGFLKRSLGITLTDKRTMDQKNHDQSRNHTVLEANMFEDFDKLDDWLGQDKIDICFERITAAWQGAPKRLDLWAAWLNKYYERSNDGAEMFFETPTLNDEQKQKILSWFKTIAYGHKTGLRLDGVDILNHFYFHLKKMPGAPRKLFLKQSNLK